LDALDELVRLIVAILRISGSRRERQSGWLAALRETLREARVMIEQAAENRRLFSEFYECEDGGERSDGSGV